MIRRLKMYFRRQDYEVVSDDEDEKYSSLLTSNRNGDNTLEVTIGGDETHWQLEMIDDQSKHIKSEKWKAFVAFLLLNFSFFVSTVSLALTHDRLPDRRIYKPLPDIILDNVSNRERLLDITEIQIMISVLVCIVLVTFHKHRFIVAKRCFFILSILYLYRSVCFYVTVLPISSPTYYCSPKSEASLGEIIKRALQVVSGMGLSINNKQIICGDSIFSGHATILIFCWLIISEYSPGRLRAMHILAIINAGVGIAFLLISHSHYSIDVIIAYYVTTRLFWSYHSCLNSTASNKNYVAREWWMPFFNYFEMNSPRSMTNEFEIPGI